MSGLSPEQIGFYKDQGYLLVEDVLPVQDLRPLVEEFEQVIDRKAREAYAEGRLNALYADEPFNRRLAKLSASLETDEIWRLVEGKGHKTAGMFSMVTHPVILDIVESVIGPEILAHPQFNSRARLPDRDGKGVPWHQDLALLNPDAEGTFIVNIWTPLVDATIENGCLVVIAGSHKKGLRKLIDGSIPDQALPEGERVRCPLRVGSMLLFQHKTIHRSLPNRSDQVRWSLDLRYCDHRLPTGREHVPGFIARSRACPHQVAKSHVDWLKLMEASQRSSL